MLGFNRCRVFSDSAKGKKNISERGLAMKHHTFSRDLNFVTFTQGEEQTLHQSEQHVTLFLDNSANVLQVQQLLAQ